jgi:flagellar biosynthetic protein FlhB
MSAEGDQERNLPASPYKLEQARKRGSVARSAEVGAAAVFGVAVIWMHWRGWEGVRELAALGRTLLGAAASLSDPQELWHLVAQALTATLQLVAPMMVVLMLAAIVAGLLQTGPLLSFQPIAPDWSRVSPAQGLSRLFSMRVLQDALKALLKLGALVLVLQSALSDLQPRFAQLSALPSASMGRELLAAAASAGLKVAVALALIALLDLVFTRRQYAKQLRMSHHELQEESRQRDGDPRIRARLRSLRKEMLAKIRALERTGDADVLLVNPTHVAVALRYEHGRMSAPQVISKGAGGLASAMRRIARQRGIPIVRNEPLARALYESTPLDAPVPAVHFAEVARLMVWVLGMRRRNEPARRLA